MSGSGVQDGEIAIVGGGIIGLSIAWALVNERRRVVVFERDAPSAACSGGNAGYLSQSGIFPVASWETLRNLPRLLADPEGPLVIRPGRLAGLTPWGLRLLANSSPKQATRTSAGLAALLRCAIDDAIGLFESAGVGELVQRRGGLHLYESRAGFERAKRNVALYRRHGIEIEAVEASAARSDEPALRGPVSGAVRFSDNAHCINPLLLGERLAEAITRAGGRVEKRDVTALTARNVGWSVQGEDWRRDVGQVVVAAGRWSDVLMKPLGFDVPLESERGYHLMLPRPNVALSRPLVAVERGFAITPMADGIRLAGTVEFASRGAPPDFARADMLYGQAKRLLPTLENTNATQWMGERPTLPDSLPAIGEASGCRGLYYAFGHQHCGLTMCGVTARLIADMVAGRPPHLAIAPYRLERFSRGSALWR